MTWNKLIILFYKNSLKNNTIGNVNDVKSNGIYIRIFLKLINKILNIDKKIEQYRKKIIYSDRAFNSLSIFVKKNFKSWN
jgi:hypothetical protein